MFHSHLKIEKEVEEIEESIDEETKQKQRHCTVS